MILICFRSSDNLQNLCNEISTELRKLNIWFKVNKLSLNVAKTNFIVFSGRKNAENARITIENNDIERVSNTKFLGVMIDEKLTWRQHISNLKVKLSKCIAVLYKCNRLLETASLRILYCSLFLPYLNYCCEVWGTSYKCTTYCISILQKRAIRLHDRLMAKLDYYGVRSDSHNWIRAFLSNRQQRVVLDGCFSTCAPVLSGVPQGTVLGPTLFLIFINDLPSCVNSSVRLFADDCVLYRRIRSVQDSITLQQDLNALNRWEENWLMEFNPDKCFVLNITRKRKPSLNTYNLHHTQLQTVNTTTYLGVEISNDLRWSHHIDKITKKANRSLSFLKRNIKTKNKYVKTLAYNSLVRPHLEYSCQVWDPHTENDINKLELVQCRAARYVTNRYHNTSSSSQMLTNLEWETLQQRRAKIRLITLYKIVNNLIEIPRNQYLTPVIPMYQHQCLNFQRPFASTNYLKFSFFSENDSSMEFIANWYKVN